MRSVRFVRYFWLALLLLIVPASSFAGVFVSVTIAPPVLPVYTQPPCPGDGYIGRPGYWAYGGEGYYWVPGNLGYSSHGWCSLDAGILGLG